MVDKKKIYGFRDVKVLSYAIVENDTFLPTFNSPFATVELQLVNLSRLFRSR